MRVTGGIKKGYNIKTPMGDRIRPAQDVVRLAIFNMIGEYIENTKVLDLFAGSGSLGIEALSRGAIFVDFVDNDKVCVQIIKENLLKTGFSEQSKVFPFKTQRFLKEGEKEIYDFIFLSPPYDQGVDLELLSKMIEVLKIGGMIVFEHSRKTEIPKDFPGLRTVDERVYGAAKVSFLQKI